MKEAREFIMKCVFILTACVSIAAVVLIASLCLQIGIPANRKDWTIEFSVWRKMETQNNIFGILPMVVGSIYVTAGAIIIGVPIAFFASVYLAKFCNEKLYKILKPAVELMAGIPSIVYGFFGLVVIVPIMQKLMGGSGKSVLTASILLGIMILPTVIGVAESSIRAVPDSYYEGALALGATRERSVFFAVLPGAKSGILAGVVLGIGRGHRRDDGGDHGSRKSAGDTEKPGYGCSNPYFQHRYGDGICNGSSQRSTDCNGSSVICTDPDH